MGELVLHEFHARLCRRSRARRLFVVCRDLHCRGGGRVETQGHCRKEHQEQHGQNGSHAAHAGVKVGFVSSHKSLSTRPKGSSQHQGVPSNEYQSASHIWLLLWETVTMIRTAVGDGSLMSSVTRSGSTAWIFTVC